MLYCLLLKSDKVSDKYLNVNIINVINFKSNNIKLMYLNQTLKTIIMFVLYFITINVNFLNVFFVFYLLFCL